MEVRASANADGPESDLLAALASAGRHRGHLSRLRIVEADADRVLARRRLRGDRQARRSEDPAAGHPGRRAAAAAAQRALGLIDDLTGAVAQERHLAPVQRDRTDGLPLDGQA